MDKFLPDYLYRPSSRELGGKAESLPGWLESCLAALEWDDRVGVGVGVGVGAQDIFCSLGGVARLLATKTNKENSYRIVAIDQG